METELEQCQIEIMVEESSMKNLLENLLPQILPKGFELGINCFIRPHQGKTDLKKSIPRKVKAFQYFPQPVKLIVIQDQDSNDCLVLKDTLVDLIKNSDPNLPYLIRIACKELENWYLGDMKAIESVYPRFKAAQHQGKAKYRTVDNVFGAYELQRLIPNFSKGLASREIPRYMDIENNRSVSFSHLVNGISLFLKSINEYELEE